MPRHTILAWDYSMTDQKTSITTSTGSIYQTPDGSLQLLSLTGRQFDAMLKIPRVGILRPSL